MSSERMDRNQIFNVLMEGGSLSQPGDADAPILADGEGSMTAVSATLVAQMIEDGVLVRADEEGRPTWQVRSYARMDLPTEFVDRRRIIRILERGWVIFSGPGWPRAVVRIDDRVDEPIPMAWVQELVKRGTITSSLEPLEPGGPKMFVYRLLAGKEAQVTLRFKSKREKDHFLGGLVDGWGENIVQVGWTGKLHDAASVDVLNTDEYRDDRY